MKAMEAVQIGGRMQPPSSPSKKLTLEYNSFEPRALRNVLLTVGTWLVAALGSVPLFSVLYMLIVKGGARLNWALFSELPPAGFELAAASAMRSRARWSPSLSHPSSAFPSPSSPPSTSPSFARTARSPRSHASCPKC